MRWSPTGGTRRPGEPHPHQPTASVWTTCRSDDRRDPARRAQATRPASRADLEQPYAARVDIQTGARPRPGVARRATSSSIRLEAIHELPPRPDGVHLLRPTCATLLADIHANLRRSRPSSRMPPARGMTKSPRSATRRYGGDPAAHRSDVRPWKARVAMVRGNHDKVCAGLEPATDFNDVARARHGRPRRVGGASRSWPPCPPDRRACRGAGDLPRRAVRRGLLRVRRLGRLVRWRPDGAGSVVRPHARACGVCGVGDPIGSGSPAPN